MGETPLFQKKLFPPPPLPQKTLNTGITDWLNQSAIPALKSSFKKDSGRRYREKGNEGEGKNIVREIFAKYL